MLCLAVPKLPEGPEWQLELKLDGYRGMGIKSNGRAHLASRNGKNFSERFPTITRTFDRLPDESVIDGEIVTGNEEGCRSTRDGRWRDGSAMVRSRVCEIHL